MSQREYKVRELVLLQLDHILFVLFRRKLPGVVFEDGLHGLIRGGVKENDRRNVFSKRFRDAGDLLGQDPHADAAMACTEPEGRPAGSCDLSRLLKRRSHRE